MKSDMEILYEQYLENRDNQNFYEKDGIAYWKLIRKDLVGNLVLITIPREAVNGNKEKYNDENGNDIIISRPAFFSFESSDIPKWYFETATVHVKNASSIEDIGEYFGAPIK